ncbi:LptA/OstA family protein [Paucibacter sp. KBW04]|uniref:LptA/OstA family protein n=1 Tax=Paucibacter sp. KBW04 TaxID=2153361 RepID=UPI0018CC11B2|nr:LptA/OstA family protein [Paucibacter sp. KBW04]
MTSKLLQTLGVLATERGKSLMNRILTLILALNCASQVAAQEGGVRELSIESQGGTANLHQKSGVLTGHVVVRLKDAMYTADTAVVSTDKDDYATIQLQSSSPERRVKAQWTAKDGSNYASESRMAIYDESTGILRMQGECLVTVQSKRRRSEIRGESIVYDRRTEEVEINTNPGGEPRGRARIVVFDKGGKQGKDE